MLFRLVLLTVLFALTTIPPALASGLDRDGKGPPQTQTAARMADPGFFDHAYLNPSRYGCRMDREILVISGEVHRELDRLLSGRDDAMSANEVVVFYEKRMGRPISGKAYQAHTRLFLDVLAACDIYLAF